MIYFRTVPQTNVLGRVNKSYQGLLPQIHCQLSKWWKQFSMRLGRCKKTVGRTDPIHVAMPRWSTCCFFSLWSACGTKWHFPTFCFFVDVPMPGQGLLCPRTDHNVVLRLERRERWSWGTTGRLHQVKVRATCTKGLYKIGGLVALNDAQLREKSALWCLLLPSRAAPLVNVTDPWLERKWRKMRDWHSAANGTRRIIWEIWEIVLRSERLQGLYGGITIRMWKDVKIIESGRAWEKTEILKPW